MSIPPNDLNRVPRIQQVSLDDRLGALCRLPVELSKSTWNYLGKKVSEISDDDIKQFVNNSKKPALTLAAAIVATRLFDCVKYPISFFVGDTIASGITFIAATGVLTYISQISEPIEEPRRLRKFQSLSNKFR